MKERTLNVELRTEYGKNACNRLRSNGFIPAVVYSHGNTEAIKVSVKNFSSIFKGRISESVLIDLNIANKSEDAQLKAFVKDYLADPLTNEVMHIDFYKITADEKIRTIVKVVVQGAPKGVKEGGVLEIHERELEIECLPKDLPEQIVVDVSNLGIGDALHISDIQIEESVKFLEAATRVIASVVTPHVKEEEEVAAAEPVEGEEVKEEKTAEEESGKAKE